MAAFQGEIFVPEMLPIVRAGSKELGLGGAVEAAGDFGDGEVVVGVFDGARAGALVSQGDVTFGVVVGKAAAPFFLRVGRGGPWRLSTSPRRQSGSQCR